MIPDACVGGVNLRSDGRSQFCMGPSPLRLDNVPETAVDRPGLAASAVSLPVRRCASKGGPAVVCRWHARPHPLVRFAASRPLHCQSGKRTQGEFLAVDSHDIPTPPFVRLANGLRSLLSEQAFGTTTHLIHSEPGAAPPAGAGSARAGATAGPPRDAARKAAILEPSPRA